MKLFGVVLASALLSTACVTQALASWTQPSTPVDPKSRIVVTLQVVRARAGVLEALEKTYTNGPVKYALLYRALLGQAGKATEMSLRTTNDVPGAAQYSRILAFTSRDHGRPAQSFVTLSTSLEATPHINGDGTITVRLKTEAADTLPSDAPAKTDATPSVTTQRMTTTRTFLSGETALLVAPAKISLITTPRSSGADTTDSKEVTLEFATVTALPPEAAVR